LRNEEDMRKPLLAKGFFVGSVGANEEIIRRYVQHQDRDTKEEEGRQQNLMFSS